MGQAAWAADSKRRYPRNRPQSFDDGQLLREGPEMSFRSLDALFERADRGAGIGERCAQRLPELRLSVFDPAPDAGHDVVRAGRITRGLSPALNTSGPRLHRAWPSHRAEPRSPVSATALATRARPPRHTSAPQLPIDGSVDGAHEEAQDYLRLTRERSWVNNRQNVLLDEASGIP